MSSQILNVKDRLGKQKIRLVFDDEKELVYWGVPMKQPTEVFPSQPYGHPAYNYSGKISIGVLKRFELHKEGNFLNKRYYIRIDGSSLRSEHWLRCSQEDGAAFVSVVTEFTERYNKAIVSREISRKSILRHFKTAGVVDLVGFTKANRNEIVSVSPVKNMNPSDEDILKKLYFFIEGAIDDGEITGVLDRENHEYRDRDFIVKQQRVVNVNVAMDFNSLVQQLGNKGVSLQSIECPQCGNSNNAPTSGSEFKCEACKSLIKVTDIFEKFKGLLT